MAGTRLLLSKRYTIEELYDKLKDVEFEAGKASIVSQGPTKWIVFPRLDWHNQVVIGGSNGRFFAQRSDRPFSNPGTCSPLHFLCSAFSGLIDTSFETKQRCEQLAEAVGRQINAMNL